MWGCRLESFAGTTKTTSQLSNCIAGPSYLIPCLYMTQVIKLHYELWYFYGSTNHIVWKCVLRFEQ